jgi:transposase
MRLDLENLPSDIDLLHRLVRDMASVVESRDTEIDRLRRLIKQFQRRQFGRRSEQLDPDQLALGLEDLDADAARAEVDQVPPSASDEAAKPRTVSRRKTLPGHLPRQEVRLDVESQACPDCGGRLHAIGAATSEMLDWVPAQLRVVRIRRPKYGCHACGTIHQAPAPERPIANGLATPGLIAQVLVSKYCDHTPLYRQAQILARHGVRIDRSTLASWVGGACWWLEPLQARLAAHVFASTKLFADDTPIPVLDPGRGRTKTGRLWVYVRDDRAWAGPDPPAAVYFYSPDRKAKRPATHLENFKGMLQVDGYAGFETLTEKGDIALAACWAHARRRFYEFHQATGSPIAAEALRRIAELYAVEKRIRGQPAKARQGRTSCAGFRRAAGWPTPSAMRSRAGRRCRGSSTTAASSSTTTPSSAPSGPWPSGARTISLPAPTAGASAGPWSRPSSPRQSSTVSSPTPTCKTCSSGWSTAIPSTGSTTSYRGNGHQNPSTPD